MGTVHQLHERRLPGRIELVEEDGGPVLRLRGEVDTLVVSAWHAGAPARRDAPVAVDVSAATFVDCRALRLMLTETEATRRSGRMPELRRPSRTVRRMLDLAGVTPLFAAVL
jgi:anti-anti-sigma factor